MNWAKKLREDEKNLKPIVEVDRWVNVRIIVPYSEMLLDIITWHLSVFRNNNLYRIET